jgi:hypothetical protein
MMQPFFSPQGLGKMKGRNTSLTDGDLDFLVRAIAPEVKDKTKIKNLIISDQDFRDGFIDDDKVFYRIMEDEDVFLKLSPRLYFEVLIRRARGELETITHTIEKAGTQKIAVFDTKEVVGLLSWRPVMLYLAEMLASFAKIQSYSISYRLKKGIWRKLRFNDLDIDSLVRFCESVDEEHRLSFFKRIADICLFTLGVFPEYVQFNYRYPFSGELRPHIAGRVRRSEAEFIHTGKEFYKLAAEHPVAETLGLSTVLKVLYKNFHTAQKPLNFIAEHYLHHYRRSLFRIGCQ